MTLVLLRPTDFKDIPAECYSSASPSPTPSPPRLPISTACDGVAEFELGTRFEKDGEYGLAAELYELARLQSNGDALNALADLFKAGKVVYRRSQPTSGNLGWSKPSSGRYLQVGTTYLDDALDSTGSKYLGPASAQWPKYQTVVRDLPVTDPHFETRLFQEKRVLNLYEQAAQLASRAAFLNLARIYETGYAGVLVDLDAADMFCQAVGKRLIDGEILSMEDAADPDLLRALRESKKATAANPVVAVTEPRPALVPISRMSQAPRGPTDPRPAAFDWRREQADSSRLNYPSDSAYPDRSDYLKAFDQSMELADPTPSKKMSYQELYERSQDLDRGGCPPAKTEPPRRYPTLATTRRPAGRTEEYKGPRPSTQSETSSLNRREWGDQARAISRAKVASQATLDQNYWISKGHLPRSRPSASQQETKAPRDDPNWDLNYWKRSSRSPIVTRSQTQAEREMEEARAFLNCAEIKQALARSDPAVPGYSHLGLGLSDGSEAPDDLDGWSGFA